MELRWYVYEGVDPWFEAEIFIYYFNIYNRETIIFNALFFSIFSPLCIYFYTVQVHTHTLFSLNTILALRTNLAYFLTIQIGF